MTGPRTRCPTTRRSRSRCRSSASAASGCRNASRTSWNQGSAPRCCSRRPTGGAVVRVGVRRGHRARPAVGSGRRQTATASSDPGTPTSRNAQRQPTARPTAPPSTSPSAAPTVGRDTLVTHRRARGCRPGSSRRSATPTRDCRRSHRHRARCAPRGTARSRRTTAFSAEITPHDAMTTAMIRVAPVAIGEIPGRKHHEEPGEHRRTAEQAGLEVAEAEIVLHLGQHAGKDLAVDRVDERDEGEDADGTAAVLAPIRRRLHEGCTTPERRIARSSVPRYEAITFGVRARPRRACPPRSPRRPRGSRRGRRSP